MSRKLNQLMMFSAAALAFGIGEPYGSGHMHKSRSKKTKHGRKRNKIAAASRKKNRGK